MRAIAPLLALALLALPSRAPAGFGLPEGPTLTCRLGRVPASVLLLPYFEVHPKKKKKGDTQLLLQSTTEVAALAHVTLWTDLAIPVLSFDLGMTGLSSERLSLSDLLVAGAAPAALVSDFNSICGGPRPVLDEACLEQIRGALSGGEAQPGSGDCAGWPHGDGLYRGYATVDAVTGEAETRVLVGDFELREKTAVFAGPLVHIREGEALPLPSDWAARFEGASASSPGSELILWRDSSPAGGFACSAPPSGVDPSEVVVYDATGTPATLAPQLLPIAAQRVRVGSERLPVTFEAGWLRLDLDGSAGADAAGFAATLLRGKKSASYSEGTPFCEIVM